MIAFTCTAEVTATTLFLCVRSDDTPGKRDYNSDKLHSGNRRETQGCSQAHLLDEFSLLVYCVVVIWLNVRTQMLG